MLSAKKVKDILHKKLDDDVILQLLEQVCTGLTFVTHRGETEKLIRDFVDKVKNHGVPPDLKSEPKMMLDVWESLLIDAIYYLKRKDKREIKDDKKSKDWIDPKSFGISELRDYFQQFSKFEHLMYGAEKYYREHTAHVLRVWVLGTSIMHALGRDKFDMDYRIKFRGDKIPKNLSIKPSEKDAMWCIIALTHDLGYPLGKINKINESIRDMLKYFGKASLEDFTFTFPPQNHFINDFILRFISSRLVKPDKKQRFKTSLQSKYYLKFSKSFENYEHGIVSCIILMKNLVFFLESDFDFDAMKSFDAQDARQFLIRREILRSIASHTCNDIYHIKMNTLPFLLILCDEAQFWGRPSLGELIGGEEKKPDVMIKSLSADDIHLLINTEEKNEDLKNYFVEKEKDFRKIFRTAVDTSDRSKKFKKFMFEITFNKKDSHSVVFETGKKVETTPDKVELHCRGCGKTYKLDIGK